MFLGWDGEVKRGLNGHQPLHVLQQIERAPTALAAEKIGHERVLQRDDVRQAADTDQTLLAQHRHAIGKRHQRIEVMSHHHDAEMQLSAQFLNQFDEALRSVRIEASGLRRETEPRRYNSVHFDFHLTAEGLDEAKARRAVDLSLTKYCSVVNSLAPDIAVTYGITLG